MKRSVIITFSFIRIPFSVAAEQSVIPLSVKQADTPKNDAMNDAEQLQGTWEIVSVEDSGRKIPMEVFKNRKWVIAKNDITLKFGDKNIAILYTLDPTKNPKCIDLREMSKITLGIYELEGENLKICYSEERPDERPTTFESKSKAGNDVFIILKRELAKAVQ